MKLFLFYLLIWSIQSFSAKEECLYPLAQLDPNIVTTEFVSSLLAEAQHRGHFPPPSPEKLKEVESRYKTDRKRPQKLATTVDGNVSIVTPNDLVSNFSLMSPEELNSHRRKGFRFLRGERAPPEIKRALDGSPYSSISPLYYFTSAAGLWSRGGGFLKFLVPLNLDSLLKPLERKELVKWGEIVSAKTPLDMLKIAGLNENHNGNEIQSITDSLSRQTKTKIHSLVDPIAREPNAINILDLKFAHIALLSQLSGSYIHFDIWTSSKTHESIREYIEWLKANYHKKTFHPDPEINKKIHRALEQYFSVSLKLGETHLFGYQEGIYALDSSSGTSIFSSEPIGEGAGMFKHYLDKTGRTTQLQKRGVSEMAFQNLEVISDIPLEYASFKESQKPVAVVVVPTMSGYKGGNPYKVTKGENVSYQLLEQSAVPEDIRNLNSPFFNSNTIYQNLGLPYVSNIGYEVKENGRQIRLKTNAGDLTLSYPTALIGGRIGHEYENFKDFREYILHGETTITTMQELWANMLK